ncbi:hypothetical protein I551_8640, partial [Mycobacterium ulcerans str. Harvey]
MGRRDYSVMAVPGARAALPARRAPVLLAGPVAAAGFSTATAELAAPVDKEWSEVREAPVVGPGSGAPVVPVGPGQRRPRRRVGGAGGNAGLLGSGGTGGAGGGAGS